MKVVDKKIAELIQAEYNPRKLSDKQFRELRDSLNRFGFVDPVLVNVNEERKNIIIGGHQRTKVWDSMGNDTVPVVELDLTLDQEKELNVRLNKSGGEFDFDMLQEHFDTDSLVEWGFNDYEFTATDMEVEEEPDSFDDEGVGYKEQYGVIVMCSDLEAQEKAFNTMMDMGYECKIVVT